MTPIAVPATPEHLSVADAHLYLMGSDGLVFCAERQRIYYLNTIASFIWCGLKEGLANKEIAKALVLKFDISPQLAERNVLEVLDTWRAGEHSASAPTAVSSDSQPVQVKQTTPAKLISLRPETPENSRRNIRDKCLRALAAECGEVRQFHYRIGDMGFCIRYPTAEVVAIVHPVLAHLVHTVSSGHLNSHISIDIVEQHGLFSLYCDGTGFGKFIAANELVPLIHRLILINTFKNFRCLAAFHAGAVCDKRASLLLPAASGSGKSTLVAALVDSGLTYQTDESVLLMPDTSLRPLPLSLGLKRGSWSSFRAGDPAPGPNSIHYQPDGTAVKYIAPAQESLPIVLPPLRALVFPKYIERRSTEITPISSAKALYRLAEAGYAVSDRLTPDLVSTLINWTSRQACYDLQTGDLDMAVAAVRNLLG